MRTITKDEILSVLPLLPEEKINPKAHYTTITFARLGNVEFPVVEHCMVGEILTRLNVQVPKEGTLENSSRFNQLRSWFNNNDIDFDNDAFDFLSMTQGWADKNYNWGDVIDALREEGVV